MYGMQRLRGSAPAFAAPHVPEATPSCFFAAVQAWQAPSHAVLQHTPSTQAPEKQLPPATHGSPTLRPNTSAVFKRVLMSIDVDKPPLTSTLPDFNATAVGVWRVVLIGPMLVKLPLPALSSNSEAIGAL